MSRPPEQNEYRVDGDIANIVLTHGQVAKVDASMLDRLLPFKWFAKWNSGTQSYYAASTQRRKDGVTYTLWMHRVVMGAPKGMHVDHKHHDTLDNRQSQLETCTHLQNMQNRRAYRRRAENGVMTEMKGDTPVLTARVKVGEQRFMKSFPVGEEGEVLAMCLTTRCGPL
jgi:hypothetical protein